MEWLYRRNWLEKLMESQTFDYVVAPLLVLLLSIWLISDFVKTRRAVNRGEPLRVWYLRDPVYPDDLLYGYFAFQREYPAILLFVFVGLIFLGLAALIAWVVFGRPLRPKPIGWRSSLLAEPGRHASIPASRGADARRNP